MFDSLSVPLTKERLEDIGHYVGVVGKKGVPGSKEYNQSFASVLGTVFERNIRNSIQSAPGNDYVKYQGKRFPSPSREDLSRNTQRKQKRVLPDLQGSIGVIDENRGTLTEFKNSSIIEVKGARDDISLQYGNYQAAGIIDYAKDSPAGRNDIRPRLTYVTSDVEIKGDLILQASLNNVALYHSKVIESCKSPGSIKLGNVSLLNPQVYARINPVTKEITIDKVTHEIPSKFIQFQNLKE